MLENYKIRIAEQKDAQQVFNLAKQLAITFEVIEEDFHAFYKEVINDEKSFLAVAEANNEAIGYVLASKNYAFHANGAVCWVEELFVEEKYRNNSVGKDLIDYLENWALSNNAKFISLATRRADSFYTKIGYEDLARYFRKILKPQKLKP